jgi:hypothetical protein
LVADVEVKNIPLCNQGHSNKGMKIKMIELVKRKQREK